ncbi:MAG TPA: hypothetical protein VK826_17825, partial [Bacteroidia bacterium]|nr:hypothetical protein [Bacteroidia bacterium]
FAMLILPQKTRTDLNPIIAFRGTSNTPDFITDTDLEGPGWTQYKMNKDNINQLIVKANAAAPGRKIDLTGHSLGGALAQWTATDETFKGKFGRVITFQSPAINRKRVNDYNAWDAADKPSTVIHHIVVNDIVPFAGEASMPGTFYTHTTQVMAPFLSHTHLMLQSEAYEKERKELGLTDAVLEALGWTGSNLPTERNRVYKTGDFPFPELRADVEHARKVTRVTIEKLGEEIEKAKKEAKAGLVRQLMMQKAAMEVYLKLLVVPIPH